MRSKTYKTPRRHPVVLLTLSIVNFQNPEPGHVVSEHDLVRAGGFVHALDDLKVAVGEVEEVLMDGDAPGVRQAGHDGDAVAPIGITTLNLWMLILNEQEPHRMMTR